jgi:hypothetical protein
MDWWTKKAGELQQSVRQDEITKVDEYTDDQVRQANVHAREDLVMLVSLLNSVNTQLSAIRWSLGLIILLGGVGVWIALRALRYI